MTTDLLSAWTDPDTAMEAVGTSLGIFGARAPDARVALAAPQLRDALLGVLFCLVDRGELEKRALADGRYAFRWHDEFVDAAVATDARSARLDACLESMRGASVATLGRFSVQTVETPAPPAPARPWARLIAPTAPLVFPAVSCMLAILAFVWLARSAALVVAVALALAGVIGLVRRVPFAGLWTLGLIVAGLLVRLS